MKVCHSHITPRLDHFKAEERGRVVSIMAVGHLLHIEVKTDWGKILVNEMVPFATLSDLLQTIPPQPERPFNRIP